MSTVTYKNQPAIHKTRGKIPLAGTKYIYEVKKILWPKEVEDFLATILIPPTLHVCCGKSLLGDVRLDLYADEIDIRADASRLPFEDNSFNTILIDPPYNSKFQWMHDMLSELPRIASKRIIFQHWFHMANKDGKFKKAHRFINTANYIWQPRTYFGRVNVISIYDEEM